MGFLLRAMLAVAGISLVACGGNSHANPAAPTPTPTATVSAVTVTSASTSGATFQLTAMARMSDGSTQDVTKTATWASSNPLLATVSAGMVSVLGTGELDMRATYQCVSGLLHLLVARLPVIAISISGASTTSSFQLTATARLSDASTQDITRSATWDSSNAQIAAVSTTGYVTVVGNGEVDIRATYQGVTGSQHFVVVLPKTFALSGVVREIAPNVQPISGATVRILSGSTTPDVTTDQGTFAFSAVPAGRVLIEISKDGYQVWESEVVIVDRDAQLTASLYPIPARDATGVSASARCNDGSWSWAQTRADACTANGGVAYTVCPGPLCQPQ
jgi:hypothetical protein